MSDFSTFKAGDLVRIKDDYKAFFKYQESQSGKKLNVNGVFKVKVACYLPNICKVRLNIQCLRVSQEDFGSFFHWANHFEKVSFDTGDPGPQVPTPRVSLPLTTMIGAAS